ncbi:MAG TPA: MFS transporter, partial [Bacteroidia bacterium]
PILTGSIFRLPFGMLTDKYGGRWVFGALIFFLAIPLYFLSKANSYFDFVLCSLGFGMAGNAFPIGNAFTSLWYPPSWQGRALGIFGAGNIGASITSAAVPFLLLHFTKANSDMEQWRLIPQVYASVVVMAAVLFMVFTKNKKSPSSRKTVQQMLQLLRYPRVWKFGVYYFLSFGCFVAVAQWIIQYYMNMYSISLFDAGLLAALFIFPSGIIRIVGGWISDRFSAFKTMRWVLIVSFFCSLLLIAPRMEIFSPGEGVFAKKTGTVKEVTDSCIVVDDEKYFFNLMENNDSKSAGMVDEHIVFPKKTSWQEPVVKVGDAVLKKQLLARGISKIYFQANISVAVVLIFLLGIAWGIGKAATYKFISDDFPEDVGTVGGIVGTLGGLGGFLTPFLFSFLLQLTGLWTSMWIFLALLSVLAFWFLRKEKKYSYR